MEKILLLLLWGTPFFAGMTLGSVVIIRWLEEWDAQRNEAKTMERRLNLNGEKEPTVTDMNGVQVFSAKFVLEQMQAQSARIERAHKMALIALLIAGASFIGIILLLCT